MLFYQYNNIIKSKNEVVALNVILEKIEKINSRILLIKDEEIEKKVIEMIFGIKGKQYKQIEISDILNIPQYKVSRIKKSFKTIKMLLIRFKKFF